MRGAHVPRIQEDRDVSILCVADPAEDQARQLMEKYGREVSYYADYRKMLKDEELDAIFISSPHSLHYDQARLALNHGLHVLVEKPLTISSRHTKGLIALSGKKGKFLQVSYQRNYYAEHTFARELIQKGKIGELRGVVSYVTQNWGGIQGWRLDPEFSGGGMFMDTGSHLVASTLWMTGLEPVQVSAFMDNSDKKVDINAVVNIRFKGGAVGTLNTFGNALVHDERIAIHGSKGCIVFHLHQWKIRDVLLNGEPIRIPSRIRQTSPDEAFFKWIRNGGKGYEAPDFALQVARVSEAAYKSVQAGKSVRVAR